MSQLSVVRRTTPTNVSPAAPAPAGLTVIKRNGTPVAQPDFRVETVGDMPDDDNLLKTLAQGAWDYIVGSAEGFNPLPAIDAIGRAFIPEIAGDKLGLNTGQKSPLTYGQKTGPLNFLSNVLRSQAVPLDRARESYAKGDAGNAIMHFTNWLAAVVGPGFDEAAYGEVDPNSVGSKVLATDSQMRRSGRVTGLLSQVLTPKAVSALVGGRKVPGVGENPDLPPEALQFAKENAIPLDAATATGSKAVRNIQAVVDNTLAETVTRRGQTFRAGQNAALERVGGELANRARPTDWTPERAGAHLRRQVERRVEENRAEAGHAYQELRDIEADPANATQVPAKTKRTSDGREAILEPARTVPLGVDVGPAKPALTAMLAEMQGKKDLTGSLQGAEGRVAVALKSLVEAEDVQPLSAVDAALSDLKAIARGDGPPTKARAAAMKVIRELEAQVSTTATANPRVAKALARGRAATKEKYVALEVLDDLKAEPVQAVRELLSSADASLYKLRALSKFVTPADMATLGRAWLQQQVEATIAGKQGWARARSEWNKVGAESRKIIFGKDQALPRDLDHFFRLAAEIEKNPNPSGTALVASTYGLSLAGFATAGKVLLGADLVSRLLYSKEGVRLLTRGLTTPTGNKLATQAIAADLATMSERVGAPLSTTPAAAEERGRLR